MTKDEKPTCPHCEKGKKPQVKAWSVVLAALILALCVFYVTSHKEDQQGVQPQTLTSPITETVTGETTTTQPCPEPTTTVTTVTQPRETVVATVTKTVDAKETASPPSTGIAPHPETTAIAPRPKTSNIQPTTSGVVR
ncbi:hypothetical protein ACIA2T_19805 [Amycolatopsis japonica]|uniref:hypothetical protein n=1 Tax=Amycolatopsis japonica TaxID=208439 RepID=UPI0037958507